MRPDVDNTRGMCRQIIKGPIPYESKSRGQVSVEISFRLGFEGLLELKMPVIAVEDFVVVW